MTAADPAQLYLVSPLGNAREGNIQLGAVFDHPLKVYEFAVAQAPSSLVKKTVGPPQTIKNLVQYKATAWGVALWTRLLRSFGLSVSADHAHDKAMIFSTDRAVTEELKIDSETSDILNFIKKFEATSPALSARIDKAPVYMVVGVMYANKLQYKIVRGQQTGAAAAAQGTTADHVTIGGYVYYLGEAGYLREGSVDGENVFAYKMLEISRKGWWKKVTRTQVVRDGTLLGSKGGDSDSDSDEDEEHEDEETFDVRYVADEDMLRLSGLGQNLD